MERQIQYAKTSDGVNIAFASTGEGPPIVRMSLPNASHVQREWTLLSNFYTPLAASFRVTLYDARGAGLSDRDAIDFSMETMTSDLKAVIDRTGLQSFALLAFLDAVPMAVTYAAKYPDQVTDLILIDGWTSRADSIGMPTREAHAALVDKDFTLLTETMARVFWGFDDPRLIEMVGEYLRACMEPEAYRALNLAMQGYDVSALLPDVKAETLVLHNNDNRLTPVRAGQKLAASIENARFLPIDDKSYQNVAGLVEEFLGPTKKPEPVESSAVRTVLFTDIVGHTEMMSRLGDSKGRDVLREHERITREVLKDHGGDEVKTMGDGFMASFSSVTKAVECAIALQRAFAERKSDEPLNVRVGINAGEPIEEDGDLFGATVILASRIAAKAEGREVLVADTVRGLCSGKGFLFSDRGEFVAKGFEDPVRLYEVRWRE